MKLGSLVWQAATLPSEGSPVKTDSTSNPDDLILCVCVFSLGDDICKNFICWQFSEARTVGIFSWDCLHLES